MPVHDIPLDKAELLSIILEAILYGFSLLMFVGTIWVLLFRKSTQQVNHKMLTAAYILLVLSTTHLVIHIVRVMEGLILNGNSYPGGPNAWFANAAQWTFVWENYVYVAQSLVGDMVVIYRCYMVWQSKLIIILPLLLWCAAFVTGFAGVHAASVATEGVFNGSLAKWITAFWVMALSTNVLTTALLAFRIWWVDRQSRRFRGHQKSHLLPILRIVLDSGVIYSLTLIASLICFVTETNGQYVTLDMVPPIISLTFYLVIVRTGLHRAGDQSSNVFPLGEQSSSGNSARMDRRNRMQVRVTTLTENKAEEAMHTPVKSLPPIPQDGRLRDEDGVPLEV